MARIVEFGHNNKKNCHKSVSYYTFREWRRLHFWIEFHEYEKVCETLPQLVLLLVGKCRIWALFLLFQTAVSIALRDTIGMAVILF